MSTYTTPQEGLAALMISGSTLVPGITWGTNASPFYEEAPEPLPQGVDGNPFPYVVYDVEESTFNPTFEMAFYEAFVATIKVYCREIDIASNASPYVSSTIFYFLDGYKNNPRVMDGVGYQCIQFLRKSWRLHKDPERGPDVGRVWISECKYDLWLTS